MVDISRHSLFSKLDPLLYASLEGATAFCKLRGNPYVELVHWLHHILNNQDSDLHRLVRHFSIDVEVLETDLTVALDRLPRGASAISDFSSFIDEAVERAWIYTSLAYESSQIRSAHLMLGLLKSRSLSAILRSMSAEWLKIQPEVLLQELDTILGGSPERPAATETRAETSATDSAEAKSALASYAVDLTMSARNGAIDPVVGREKEIRKLIDILLRRRQNNPLLTGEAGVGKTAVVEGLALRLAAGEVPPLLREATLYMLDLGSMQAGAGVKGEFEQRLQQIVREVESSTRPVLLFIDEVHTLIGAGGTQGTGDAANLLKPMLARGRLRMIGATTWSEYKKYIEKDPALTRRFEAVQVHEPSEAQATAMLRGLAAKLGQHHQILILDEAIEAAVALSHRHLPARQLPDKAISLLDTACARVASGRHAPPPVLEDCLRRIQAFEVELDIARRECNMGLGAVERVDSLAIELSALNEERRALEARCEHERALVERITDLRARLIGIDDEAERAPLLAELERAHAELAASQGELPLLSAAVDREAVAAVLADWTGIPVGRMVRNEVQAILELEQTLSRRVIGQSHAMEVIARRIQNARARLDDPGKPVGVFLLCGPSGVGKTETALALAESLYGGERNLITLNMSEFQEAHTVSILKGAPPGYVGYGEGGVLTEAVRRQPHSVVLLDEMEKAHRDVQEAFFQVFDKGWMEDGEGRRIDFKNTVILLTTNAGDNEIAELCRGGEPTAASMVQAVREVLLDVFSAAFLGRLVVVPYYPLSTSTLAAIVQLQLDRIVNRMADQHGITFRYDDRVVDLIGRRCTEVESGGRMIEAIITNTLLPPISRTILASLADGRNLGTVSVEIDQDDFAYHFSEKSAGVS